MPSVAVGKGYVKGTKEVTGRKKEKRNMDRKDQPNLSFMEFVRTAEKQETQRTIYVPSMEPPQVVVHFQHRINLASFYDRVSMFDHRDIDHS